MPRTQVTLATVAPGIAEALVATRPSAFCSHPLPWWPTNRFAGDIDRIATQQENVYRRVLQHSATGGRTGHGFGALTMPVAAHRGRGLRTINEINMVPFIDVMLVVDHLHGDRNAHHPSMIDSRA